MVGVGEAARPSRLSAKAWRSPKVEEGSALPPRWSAPHPRLQPMGEAGLFSAAGFSLARRRRKNGGVRASPPSRAKGFGRSSRVERRGPGALSPGGGWPRPPRVALKRITFVAKGELGKTRPGAAPSPRRGSGHLERSGKTWRDLPGPEKLTARVGRDRPPLAPGSVVEFV